MSELLDEIRKRINWPGEYVTRQADSRETDGMEAGSTYAARAVATLFATAEPEADSKLREIDLPLELVEAANMLREAAEQTLDPDSTYAGTQEEANRLGYLANIVQDVSRLIEDPATMLTALMQDRDLWQAAYKSQAELLQLTEAGLGASQASGLSLAEGQSKLIGLLEQVARACENLPPVATELDKVLPDIRAVLNQVTVLEKDADGRLIVARQPEPEKEA